MTVVAENTMNKKIHEFILKSEEEPWPGGSGGQSNVPGPKAAGAAPGQGAHLGCSSIPSPGACGRQPKGVSLSHLPNLPTSLPLPKNQ